LEWDVVQIHAVRGMLLSGTGMSGRCWGRGKVFGKVERRFREVEHLNCGFAVRGFLDGEKGWGWRVTGL
jgi:hypothetical protein